ncbi:hypothetical protein HY485_01140 [Candidatus Woesearchaeota archaeon]|nr:hypothetical protein [Candidatus Woesearchaeota archaeon]
MEIVSKISRGTLMDQIYLPKKRAGFIVGSYVRVEPLQTTVVQEKLFFYNVEHLEPLKVSAIKEIFAIADKTINIYDNIIITGSFLDNGFTFNDIDILVVSQSERDTEAFKKSVKNSTGLIPHIIVLDNKTLVEGLSTDPLYQTMLSKCIAKKRFIYKIQHRINYKLLDLHLLKSEILPGNFNVLNGTEKYYLTRNMVAIYLFLKEKKTSKEQIDTEIKQLFNLKNIEEIKQNMLDKNNFIKKYKEIYNDCFNQILKGIQNASKQKQTG